MIQVKMCYKSPSNAHLLRPRNEAGHPQQHRDPQKTQAHGEDMSKLSSPILLSGSHQMESCWWKCWWNPGWKRCPYIQEVTNGNIIWNIIGNVGGTVDGNVDGNVAQTVRKLTIEI